MIGEPAGDPGDYPATGTPTQRRGGSQPIPAGEGIPKRGTHLCDTAMAKLHRASGLSLNPCLAKIRVNPDGGHARDWAT